MPDPDSSSYRAYIRIRFRFIQLIWDPDSDPHRAYIRPRFRFIQILCQTQVHFHTELMPNPDSRSYIAYVRLRFKVTYHTKIGIWNAQSHCMCKLVPRFLLNTDLISVTLINVRACRQLTQTVHNLPRIMQMSDYASLPTYMLPTLFRSNVKSICRKQELSWLGVLWFCFLWWEMVWKQGNESFGLDQWKVYLYCMWLVCWVHRHPNSGFDYSTTNTQGCKKDASSMLEHRNQYLGHANPLCSMVPLKIDEDSA